MDNLQYNHDATGRVFCRLRDAKPFLGQEEMKGQPQSSTKTLAFLLLAHRALIISWLTSLPKLLSTIRYVKERELS